MSQESCRHLQQSRSRARREDPHAIRTPAYSTPTLDLIKHDHLLSSVKLLAVSTFCGAFSTAHRRRFEALAIGVEDADDRVLERGERDWDKLDVLRLLLPKEEDEDIDRAMDKIWAATRRVEEVCEGELRAREVGGGGKRQKLMVLRLGSPFPVLRRVIIPERVHDERGDWVQPVGSSLDWEEEDDGDEDGEEILGSLTAATERA